MDIFILSDGNEIGPFSEETAQTLINQGTVAATDLAWASGMEDWAPLAEMLLLRETPDQSDLSDRSDPSEQTPASPTEAAPQIEPATAKQKAFLSYLSVPFPEDLAKEQASILLNGAMDDPAFGEQIGKWGAERLRLHPDLFAAEAHARKEDRASHFFDICQTEGAQYFTRITKAHCQVLVSFLDGKFPKWDSRIQDAATNYFYPAIAEKFPQLIERQWKNRFHYAEEPGTESARKTARPRVKRHVTPLEAVVRGLALGSIILVALYFAQRMIPRWISRHAAEKAVSEASASPAYPPASVASAERHELAGSSTSVAPTPKKKKIKAAAENPVAAPPATPAPADDSPAATGAPMAVGQSPEKPPSDPSMAAPPPAPSGDSAAASAPPAADAPAPAAAPAKSNLVLTKPVDLQLAYGKVKIPVGTAVTLVSRDGAWLKVNYLNNVIVIPVSSTDIDSAAPDPGAPSSGPPASTTPATPPGGAS